MLNRETVEWGEICSFNRATRLGLRAHIHVPAVLTPGKEPPSNHWMSPTVDTYTVEKGKISRPCRQSNRDPSVIATMLTMQALQIITD